jgi:hypothetical protein
MPSCKKYYLFAVAQMTKIHLNLINRWTKYLHTYTYLHTPNILDRDTPNKMLLLHKMHIILWNMGNPFLHRYTLIAWANSEDLDRSLTHVQPVKIQISWHIYDVSSWSRSAGTSMMSHHDPDQLAHLWCLIMIYTVHF